MDAPFLAFINTSAELNYDAAARLHGCYPSAVSAVPSLP
jgi:hypothetical protein